MCTTRKAIVTEDAPGAIGPYSQAISTSGLLFCSGQIALDPRTGELVGGDDVGAQTVQVMDNLAAVLDAGGVSFADVVKATIYLKDMNDFAAVNEVYGARMTDPPPARATVEVSRLPKDVKVEIDLIAAID